MSDDNGIPNADSSDGSNEKFDAVREFSNPYENQLIGCFLTAIGFSAAKADFERPPSVNLAQQTPDDSKMGDLLVRLNKFIAIEFKRTDEPRDFSKEKAKWDVPRLSGYLSADANLARSKRLHFLAFRWESEMVSASYMPLITETNLSSSLILNRTGIASLIAGLMNSTAGGSATELVGYLQSIAQFRKSPSGSSGWGAANDLLVLGMGEDGILAVVSAAGLEMSLTRAKDEDKSVNYVMPKSRRLKITR